MLSAIHIVGVVFTVAILVAVGILSGRKVKDAKSFAAGGNNGSWLVCGTILGTLVGGQSTIGTAQLAFSFGLSAWWFTLGAAIGAVLLGMVYAGPLRRSGCTTLMEVVRAEFGPKAEAVGSMLFLVGIFISIVSQQLSSAALLGSLFGLPMAAALAVGVVLIGLLVCVGGIKSAGAGGIVKLVLLYVSSVVAGVLVWRLGNGINGLWGSVDTIYQSPTLRSLGAMESAADVHSRYSSFLARGPLKDLGGCLSLALGVVCTQTYAQAILSAATTRKARRGALYCAALIPLIGAASTLVGLYMRGHYVTAAEAAAVGAAGEALPAGVGVIADSLQAFPVFVLRHMPAWFGGIVLGTLVVNILGSGSGLVLGASTVVVRDVLRMGDSRRELLATRVTIMALLVLSAVVASFAAGTFINDLGYLSLGLRAVALLLPLAAALWLPGCFGQRAVVAAMVAGVAAMLIASLLRLPADALYYGLAVSAVILLPSWKRPNKK
ncbi:MAG: hypothetical protein IJ789_08125 [Bacteroidales bacterium]|nr:hypothetical protein [Bacteroidales bacterium]